MDFLNPYNLQVITFIVLNCILAISIFITLATGQLSLGHAGFMSIGAYTSSILSKNADMPLFIAILAGALMAGLIALLIGAPTLKLHGLYLAIATLGFGEVVRVILLNMKITNGALGITGLKSLGTYLYDWEKMLGITAQSLGVTVPVIKSLSTLVFMLLLFLIILFLTLRLNSSRLGRAFEAIRADETAARAMGIQVNYYKMLAFIIGSVLAGLCGGLFAHITTAITPNDFNYHKVVEILSFAVIGGTEVVWGALFGAIALTTLPEVLRGLAEYKMIFYGAIMVLVMAVRPRGLIGSDTLQKLFRRNKKHNDQPKGVE
ncbi:MULTISPECIES: branched-chain amino acid ABC transporter permease [Brevibacillus]|uniref:branched-chain amino acid ABC transporter permease n=1 Tax=Brevibacillus TaxID=55080 RepID=UPI00203C6A9B|nr:MULTISPECIES: branched-chain amino acid ABC transporter permease [Brevibacillus]MCM3081822.1 branched-chain amino acid ABC transporter permease [Brevibacillus invocatus]MCM3432229.1 branched-chain amino acid ABC transporter permease [Brevibacillus invocatus]MDH4619588.1 branched-chain amino acid ABC transporter permease [Brevibacillus sp. AY1]